MPRVSASLMLGTSSPVGVSVAMPRLTRPLTTISWRVVVPGGVHQRVGAEGGAQRSGHHGQRGQLEAVGRREGAEALPQLHQPGRVDGQELGDVRDREGRGGHGGRDLAAGAANRDPLLAPVARLEGRGRGGRLAAVRAAVEGAVDVVAGDAAVAAGADQGGQVDPAVLGVAAHRRGGPRALGGRGRGGGRRGRWRCGRGRRSGAGGPAGAPPARPGWPEAPAQVRASPPPGPGWPPPGWPPPRRCRR